MSCEQQYVANSFIDETELLLYTLNDYINDVSLIIYLFTRNTLAPGNKNHADKNYYQINK
jgi:hypothetical protein